MAKVDASQKKVMLIECEGCRRTRHEYESEALQVARATATPETMIYSRRDPPMDAELMVVGVVSFPPGGGWVMGTMRGWVGVGLGVGLEGVAPEAGGAAQTAKRIDVDIEGAGELRTFNREGVLSNGKRHSTPRSRRAILADRKRAVVLPYKVDT